MPENAARNPVQLRIRQANLNNSDTAHHTLINSDIHLHYDVILLQEPYKNVLKKVPASSKWRVVYPTDHLISNETIRAVTLVNVNLSTNYWHQIDVPGTNDLVAIQLLGPYGTASILNIYNDIHHSRTLAIADEALTRISLSPLGNPLIHERYIIWAGDFNRHHPRWDEERNRQLFKTKNIEEAEALLEIVDEHGLDMTLPKDIPTLRANNNGNWTRPDNVFCSANAIEVLVKCTTIPGDKHAGTDHVPIDTVLELPVEKVVPPVTRNFRTADWDAFTELASEKIASLPAPSPIHAEEVFHQRVASLMKALKDTIDAVVPLSKPCPHSKRWWNKDLERMRKLKSKLNNQAYKNRANPDHPSHQHLREVKNRYTDALREAKQKHWTDFLENTNESTLWTAARFIDSPTAGEGGAKTRIPTLKVKNPDGTTTTAQTNREKARIIAKSFFPPPPQNVSVPPGQQYPDPVQYTPRFTRDQIRHIISKLSPHKAPGPDGIPNVVYMKCINILLDHLYYIYNASIGEGYYYETWLGSLTAVIRKPGRQSYDIAKSYRPIALLNTIAKIFTALIAQDITTLAEQHKLLPAHHLGGRPGRRTTDSMHLLTHRIKHAWRNGRVASVLFLDIEGAFLNAVKERLLHNMKMRRIPEPLVRCIDTVLTGRHTSDRIPLVNGIGQEDPLSMIVYLFYNADILDIPRSHGELAAAFVDDTALFAEGLTFADTHTKLRGMMNRNGGAFEWSADHNSKFEVTKFALIDFSRQKDIERPPLLLRQTVIEPTTHHEFLGVIFDQELRWRQHTDYTVAKASKWNSLFKRIAKTRSGLSSQQLRRLYIAVAVPKITYAADVWFTPLHTPPGHKNRSGSVAAAVRLTQRQAALAITGCFRTTATDYVEAHANLLPIELLMKDLCFRAYTRMVAIDDKTHPIYKIVKHIQTRPAKRHPSPIHVLYRLFSLKQGEIAPPPLHSIDVIKRSLFKCTIDPSRDNSIETEAKCATNYKIFPDGSTLEGGVGASAVMLDTITGERTTCKFHLGKEKDHTTYEGELIGILMAIHLATHIPANRTATIFCDNQPTLQAIEKPPTGPASHIISYVSEAMKTLTARRAAMAQSFHFHWIPSHSGVLGNELADQAAKDAARGSSSPNDRLPKALTTPLPRSSTAIWTANKALVDEDWLRMLDKSPRKERLRSVNPGFHPRRYHKIVKVLPRAQSSLLNQFRSNHVALNGYLHRIQRRDNPHCEHCPGAKETVRRFVLECPAHREARRSTLDTLGRDARSLSRLLSSSTGIAIFIKYIAATKRFSERTGVG